MFVKVIQDQISDIFWDVLVVSELVGVCQSSRSVIKQLSTT